jgi:hypothetical protein
MERDVERHHRYYLKLWRRAQANDMPLDDPFVQGICRAWDGVNQLAQIIERMKNQLPQHYRPLAKPTKTSGLAERELPWAEKQRQAAAEVEAQRTKPRAPHDSVSHLRCDGVTPDRHPARHCR